MGQTIEMTPRLMPANRAAAYLGVSPSTLRKLPIPRRCIGSKRLYDRIDLDAYADSLPNEGEERNTCDEVFG